ncbi:hypothetical protein BV25DRAFT_1995243 [Artomyces pyxidatus]|uniref:Uncharacterized protein n=1 Tax=Artomyces pyxidatus TaxID=48021 RepID=A0ACB8SLA6_9AGAM|nr:hypothetical protein BV25DRAFT_1995243 [Artomyces pyxidatus]
MNSSTSLPLCQLDPSSAQSLQGFNGVSDASSVITVVSTMASVAYAVDRFYIQKGNFTCNTKLEAVRTSLTRTLDILRSLDHNDRQIILQHQTPGEHRSLQDIEATHAKHVKKMYGVEEDLKHCGWLQYGLWSKLAKQINRLAETSEALHLDTLKTTNLRLHAQSSFDYGEALSITFDFLPVA